MSEQPTLVDDAERSRIATDLDTTLFVEAGAGSGKTTALVARIVSLVTSDHPVPLRNIAAITFTTKAADELRARLRRRFDELDSPTQPPTMRGRAREALGELDGAAISTLHAFAQRLISEFPIEAGLPPTIEVLDEITAALAFDEFWRSFLAKAYDDPELNHRVGLAFAAGFTNQHLRDLAAALEDNWDLLPHRLPARRPVEVPTNHLVAAGRELVARRSECTDGGDKLLVVIDRIAALVEELVASNDDREALAVLGAYTDEQRRASLSRTGRATNWAEIADMRSHAASVLAAIHDARADVIDALLGAITHDLAEETLRRARERRAAGRLQFHDLLVIARDLLRSPDHGAEACTALTARYQRLLLDEFQDTDPIQLEIALLLAQGHIEGEPPDLRPDDARPGHLFFVGDPKQAIYRFRRADITTFLAARSTYGRPPVSLSTNFRSSPRIIAWVNQVFGVLMRAEPGSQPDYVALQPDPSRFDPDRGPGVALLGERAHPKGTRADELRASEAGEIAAVVQRALGEPWEVTDPHSKRHRPATAADITILVPTRASVPHLRRALDAAGIANRSDSSGQLWASPEVQEVLSCLRAIARPDDELALVSALRTTIYGCGDDDLYRFRHHHDGQWNLHLPLPTTLEPGDPVADAVEHLRTLHDDHLWHPPAVLVERLLRERHVLEAALAAPQIRERWRRLRFVQDQARFFADATGGSLRAFLEWAHNRAASGARIDEPLIPERDDESVRIMTIHASKGLEFPITIVAGLYESPQRRRRRPQLIVQPGEEPIGVALTSELQTHAYAEQLEWEQRLDHHERIRLLYVACTRAQDHLVVSTHRVEERERDDEGARSSPDLIEEASRSAHHELLVPDADSLAPVAVTTTASRLPVAPDQRQGWRASRHEALTRIGTANTLSATSVAAAAGRGWADDPGWHKDPQDLDLPPWIRGRFGTAVGRAVHAVLQTIDLATGEGLDDLVAAQCSAEGVTGSSQVVTALVRAALGSDIVREAASRRHWRETYVAAPLAGRVVEGYIDLLYETPAGLVVVDHKTDRLTDGAGMSAKSVRYRLQAATYAAMVERSTGRDVSRAVVLFLDPDGATAHEVTNLRAAIDEVEGIVARIDA